MDIKKRVNQIVRKYGTRNPLEIVEKMDMILVRYPLEGVRGFYHYFQRNHIIYVDDRLPEHIILFVIAHELGHVFLHKNSNAIFMDTRTHFVKNKYENEAKSFCYEFTYKRWRYRRTSWIYNISAITSFRIWKSLIELRLKNFNWYNRYGVI